MASGSSASAATLPALSSANIGGNPEADFLLGITGLAIHDQTFDGPSPAAAGRSTVPSSKIIGGSHQPLTLNLGLAWDMTTPITEADGRQANYVPATGQLLIANQNGVSASAGIKMDWTALEPRIGATWKVFGSDKTVLRAGYAIFHDSAWSQGAQGLWQNPPFLGESDAFAASRLRLCHLVLRHHARTNAFRHQSLQRISGHSLRRPPPPPLPARSIPSPRISSMAGCSNTT